MRKIKNILFLLPIIFSGCLFTPVVDHTRFYTMGIALKNMTDNQSCATSIGIDKVSIPHYLDKPQIVTQISDNEIVQDEFNRWVEPVEDCITRTLHHAIGQNSNLRKIVTLQSNNSNNLDYKIHVLIHDFIPNDIDKTITLFSTWYMTDRQDNHIVSKESRITTTYISDDNSDDDEKKEEKQNNNKYVHIVSGMEQAVIQLGTEIAESISMHLYTANH